MCFLMKKIMVYSLEKVGDTNMPFWRPFLENAPAQVRVSGPSGEGLCSVHSLFRYRYTTVPLH